MRYNATIRYEGAEVTIKVTNKELEGSFELKEFLKKMRETRNHNIIATHMMTDYPTDECEAFESGEMRIPKDYLKCFARSYGLPMKLAQLGYDPEQETKSKLAQRLKELRLQHELSQMMVACDLGVARSTYACYESGKNEPDIYTLVRIADYYKVSLDYLVGRF